MQKWTDILTHEGFSWALLDEQGRVLAASGEDAPPAGTLFPTDGVALPVSKAVRFLSPQFGTVRLYPLEEGKTLAVWGASPQALREALEAERSRLPAFISTVTHELRLPLTSIKGYADLLVKGVMGPVTDQQAQFLTVIRNNVERMATLIDRVSEMGKLESGRLRPKREPIDLAGVLSGIVAQYRPLCEEKKQTLKAEIPESLPKVLGDRGRVSQIVEAMVDNAHRYTPEGGSITVRAEPQGDEVVVWVCDTGIGIGPDDAERVFTPFFRSEAEEVRAHQGWGLSLHVAHTLAEKMDGAMGFESETGKGTCFWLRLRRAQSD